MRMRMFNQIKTNVYFRKIPNIFVSDVVEIFFL